MRKKIAIIGSGISGLTCAHLLHKTHDITLFEANNYIGGHTATKDISVANKEYAIDTGFIVFNDWTYPNFIKLITKLGVEFQASEMSFSVKNTAQNLEYNGNTINSLFAQRRNILRPMFWRIVLGILKFNKLCKQHAQQNKDFGSQTLYEFLVLHRFHNDFINNYILPMCAAIWSTNLEEIKAFPFEFFLRFFTNHGLLNITDRPQWYTIVGGSRNYITPLIAGFEQHIQLNTPVQSVARVEQQQKLTLKNGKTEMFDDVIFACHSDQALKMLANPSAAQQQILGNLPYAENQVVLHTDTDILPNRKLAWASWNYLLNEDSKQSNAPVALTYNMNILQRLQTDTTFCVSLNSDVAANQILGQYQYAHPQFNIATIEAQQRRNEISGLDGQHFCGAYWYNGFHEDGVRSALDVCEYFGESL